MTTPGMFEALFGEDRGPQLRMVCTILATFTEADWQKALAEIERTDTLMPMLDPTTWIRTNAHDKIPQYREIVQQLMRLSGTVRRHVEAGD